MTNPTPHPLAATIMEWAKDMQVDQSIVWQCRHRGTVYWMDCDGETPRFSPVFEYRRKPAPERSREVVVNGERVMRGVWEPPKDYEDCWIACPTSDRYVVFQAWACSNDQLPLLIRGLVYRYDERHLAEAMARAMLKPLVGEG